MGAVASVAAGFVATGIGPFDTVAMTWTSPDGSASPDGSVWIAVQDQPAFHFHDQPVRFRR